MARSLDQLLDHLFANSRYDEQTGCWIWMGTVHSQHGYGRVCYQGRYEYLHRFAYKLEHPNEHLNVIRHTCNRPRCWAVGHLRNGTQADNVADRNSKGSANNNAVLKEEQVREIHRLLIENKTSQIKIAKMFSVTSPHISCIKHGYNWRHIYDEFYS